MGAGCCGGFGGLTLACVLELDARVEAVVLDEAMADSRLAEVRVDEDRVDVLAVEKDVPALEATGLFGGY